MDDATIASSKSVNLSWVDIANANLYKLEVESAEQTPFSAIVKPGVSSYTLPPFVNAGADGKLRWRISAMNAQGDTVARSGWRNLRIQAAE